MLLWAYYLISSNGDWRNKTTGKILQLNADETMGEADISFFENWYNGF